jgi:PHD/YefM family antitoxin component YafN of YafNO toxin-antitoxin module
MNVKYITDDSGKRSAVIVPLEEWEMITAKISAMQEDLESLSPEDEIERCDAYDEMKQGKTLNLREAIKNW